MALKTQYDQVQEYYDVVIIGAGAAGLMCGIEAGNRGRKVLLIDHANRVGKKILISGGGRCNFTNLSASPDDYESQNPYFCIPALKSYTPDHFIYLVDSHNIPYYEKKLGQLFCQGTSREIVDMLVTECDRSGEGRDFAPVAGTYDARISNHDAGRQPYSVAGGHLY